MTFLTLLFPLMSMTAVLAGGEQTNPYRSADTVIYHLQGPPVAPQYQVNYTVTVTKTRVRVVVESEDHKESTKRITTKQFIAIVRALSAAGIRKGDLGEDDRCAGGSSESIKVLKARSTLLDASVYHCGGKDFGDLIGNIEMIRKKLRPFMR